MNKLSETVLTQTIIGVSPSGKAPGFDPGIRRFESSHPSHFSMMDFVAPDLVAKGLGRAQEKWVAAGGPQTSQGAWVSETPKRSSRVGKGCGAVATTFIAQ